MSTAIVETEQSLSIERFSYSCVVNSKPSLETQEDDFSLSFSSRFSIDEANSFIEMDPTLPPSRRFFRVEQQDFSTPHIPTISASNFEEVHVDELIYNGYVMSLFEKDIEKNDASPICLHGKQEVPYLRKVGSASLRRCRRLSKNIFLKYLDILRPLCKKIRILQSKKFSVKKCSSAMEDNWYWRRSCDSENSIYEAVLHCKRSINAGK